MSLILSHQFLLTFTNTLPFYVTELITVVMIRAPGLKREKNFLTNSLSRSFIELGPEEKLVRSVYNGLFFASKVMG